MNARRRLVAASAAVLIALSAVAPCSALPFSGGGFSVSGKGGPFIKRVASRKLDAADGSGQGLGLSDAVNQGAFQAARLHMPKTEAKVAALLARLDGQWPYARTQPVRVYIVGIDFYSAYALPDGSIMVGMGLLEHATSDDEVAFILSHELGHIRLRHFTKSASLQRRRAAIAQLGQLYNVGSELRSGNLTNAVQAAQDPQAYAAQRRGQATGDLMNFLSNAMVEPSWSRNQEDEADALGFDLAQQASYAADTASARVFDTIQADADTRAATNAALQARMKQELSDTASDTARSAASSGFSPGGLTHGLLGGMGKIALTAAAGSQDAGPKHRPPEQRKAGIAEYSAAAYPEGLPLRDEQDSWLKDLRSTSEFADAQVVTAAVRQAMELRAKGDYAGAEAQIARATKTSLGSAPMVTNEAARIRDDMGDTARADALFRKAHKSPDQSLDGYLDHVRLLYRVGQYDGAMQIIREGIARFDNDDKPFLAMLVAVSRRSGLPDEAQRYLKECLAQNDEDLKKDCQQMAAD